ncbi:General substrate transporter [Mycena sanguinolenta]|uniref:General substrate transporter n=1 Tax=Mycena sanguinolenta TaxID=230812 RepID=A0A8H6Z7G6_9AGAR|nr:General substrate transporter [Mycena sanguinolenta]
MGGYGRSKYIAEQLLARSSLDVTCLRIGQVPGALPKGLWSTSEWVPILVKTSIALGRLPLASGFSIFAPPHDTVAKAIIDVAFHRSQNGECTPLMLNLVHPQPDAWNFVMNCIHDALLKPKNGSNDLEFVSFADWYGALEAREDRDGYIAEDIPGLKLLDLFSCIADMTQGAEFGSICYCTDKMRMVSPAMRTAESITKKQVDAWVGYWRSSGFI